MNETSLVKEALLEIPKIPGVRAWRVNTGVAYGQSELDKLAVGLDARPVRYGIPGQADISGIIAPSGRRLEVECKVGRNGQSEEQKNWQRMIERHGGLYIIGRSAEQIVNDIKHAIQSKVVPISLPAVLRPGSSGPEDQLQQPADTRRMPPTRRAA